MKFQSHIPKPKHTLMFLSIFLLALAIGISIPSIKVYADGITEDDVNEVAYNGTHDDTRGGNSAIVNGVAYTRTGYLCYLLTKDGDPTGDPAYAFYSPGYNEIAGSQWVCTPRVGQPVSSWKGEAPWGVTPWGNGGSPSYEPDIRDWMLHNDGGVFNAVKFVADNWGKEAAKNFQSDNYILVIETIMNFQYSVAGGSGGPLQIDKERIREAARARAEAIAARDGYRSDTPERRIYVEKIAADLAGRAIAKLIAEGGNAGSNRTFTSPPLIGTVPNLITYKNGNTVFDSYTNKVAPHSEKIKVNEAGFTAYTGSGALSDSEVQSYGVAMLIIHCKSDAIHTYWEPHGSPGNPEPRIPGKTGTCNIVKGYYKENLTTGAKQSLGVYYELDVTSNIIVSGEPNFELVEC